VYCDAPKKINKEYIYLDADEERDYIIMKFVVYAGHLVLLWK
jgi:hypothetical protein